MLVAPLLRTLMKPGTLRVVDARGRLHTFAIVYRAPTPAFREYIPYIPAVVELEEGARIPTWLVDIKIPEGHIRPYNLRCGIAVAVLFRQMDENITLPMFRLA